MGTQVCPTLNKASSLPSPWSASYGTLNSSDTYALNTVNWQSTGNTITCGYYSSSDSNVLSIYSSGYSNPVFAFPFTTPQSTSCLNSAPCGWTTSGSDPPPPPATATSASCWGSDPSNTDPNNCPFN